MGNIIEVIDQTDHADDWRRIHRPGGTLVIERHVAARDRRAELLARLGHAGGRLAQLEIHFGPARITKVEIIRNRQRAATGAGDVARRLGDGDARAEAGVEIAIASIAVGLERERAARVADADDRRVAPRSNDRVRPHGVVVLPVDPHLAGDRRRRENLLKCPQKVGLLGALGDRRDVAGAQRSDRRILACIRSVRRTVGDELGARELGDHPIAFGNAIYRLGDHFTDH